MRTRAKLRFCFTNVDLAKFVGDCVTNVGQAVQMGVEIRWLEMARTHRGLLLYRSKTNGWRIFLQHEKV